MISVDFWQTYKNPQKFFTSTVCVLFIDLLYKDIDCLVRPLKYNTVIETKSETIFIHVHACVSPSKLDLVSEAGKRQE